MRTALAVVAAMVAVFAAVIVARLALAPKPFVASFELHSQHELSLEDAETQIAIPLEEAVAGLEGVAALHTHVDAREVVLTVELKPGVPFDAVVFPAIQKTSEVQTHAAPPSIVSTREREQTTYLSISGELPAMALDDLVENQVRLDLLHTPGYRDVEVCGPGAPATVITLDPAAAAGAGVEPIDVLRKLEHAGSAAGARVTEGQQAFVVRGTGANLDELRSLPLANNVRLSDVALIAETSAGPRCTGWNQGPAVGAAIRHLPDADPKALGRVLAALPPSVKTRTLRVDRTLTLVGPDVRWPIAELLGTALRKQPGVHDVAVEVTTEGSTMIAKARVELDDPHAPSLLTVLPLLTPEAHLGDLTMQRIDGEDLGELSVSGPDLESLERTAKDVEAHLGRLGRYTSSRAPRERVRRIELDRDVLARMKLDASDVTDVLRLTSDEGAIVATEYRQTSLRHVHLKLPKLEPESLAVIRVGKGVPLASVAQLTETDEPAWIDRDDRERVIRFQTAATPAQLNELVKDLRLPNGVVLRRGGGGDGR